MLSCSSTEMRRRFQGLEAKGWGLLQTEKEGYSQA